MLLSCWSSALASAEGGLQLAAKLIINILAHLAANLLIYILAPSLFHSWATALLFDPPAFCIWATAPLIVPAFCIWATAQLSLQFLLHFCGICLGNGPSSEPVNLGLSNNPAMNQQNFFQTFTIPCLADPLPLHHLQLPVVVLNFPLPPPYTKLHFLTVHINPPNHSYQN